MRTARTGRPGAAARLGVLLLAAALLGGLSACGPGVSGPASAASPATAAPRTARAGYGPMLRVLLGNLLFRRGDTLGATWRYLQALASLESGGQSAERVHYNLSGVYASLGEIEAALDRLAGAVDPADPELVFRANFNLGCLEYTLGRYSGAAAAFIRALEIRPGSWEAKVNLELCLGRLHGAPETGRSDEAQPRQRLSLQDQQVLSEIHAKERTLWQGEQETGPSRDGTPDW